MGAINPGVYGAWLKGHNDQQQTNAEMALRAASMAPRMAIPAAAPMQTAARPAASPIPAAAAQPALQAPQAIATDANAMGGGEDIGGWQDVARTEWDKGRALVSAGQIEAGKARMMESMKTSSMAYNAAMDKADAAFYGSNGSDLQPYVNVFNEFQDQLGGQIVNYGQDQKNGKLFIEVRKPGTPTAPQATESPDGVTISNKQEDVMQRYDFASPQELQRWMTIMRHPEKLSALQWTTFEKEQLGALEAKMAGDKARATGEYQERVGKAAKDAAAAAGKGGEKPITAEQEAKNNEIAGARAFLGKSGIDWRSIDVTKDQRFMDTGTNRADVEELVRNIRLARNHLYGTQDPDFEQFSTGRAPATEQPAATGTPGAKTIKIGERAESGGRTYELRAAKAGEAGAREFPGVGWVKPVDVTEEGKAAAPARAPAASTQKATDEGTPPDPRQAGYKQWMKAKNRLDEVRKQASKMGKSAAEVFLAARVPALEAEIRKYENYAER